MNVTYTPTVLLTTELRSRPDKEVLASCALCDSTKSSMFLTEESQASMVTLSPSSNKASEKTTDQRVCPEFVASLKLSLQSTEGAGRDDLLQHRRKTLNEIISNLNVRK